MIPAYLYQYTTMNSALAILENKTIRFSRLDSLNDLNEGCCGEYAHLKKYVYISSWSADDRESIPMWSLYGRKNNALDEGVRIKVPTNLFTFDENGNLANNLRLEKILGGWNAVTKVRTKPIAISIILKSFKKMFGDDIPLVALKKVVGPVKVNYITNQEYMRKYSSIIKKEKLNKSIFIVDDIGYEKVDDWAYENEYRFWMQYPNINAIFGDDENVFKKDVRYTESSFIDVFFNEKALFEMEITLAPNFNTSLIDSFKSSLEKLGFSKELQKSTLDVRM